MKTIKSNSFQENSLLIFQGKTKILLVNPFKNLKLKILLKNIYKETQAMLKNASKTFISNKSRKFILEI